MKMKSAIYWLACVARVTLKKSPTTSKWKRKRYWICPKVENFRFVVLLGFVLCNFFLDAFKDEAKLAELKNKIDWNAVQAKMDDENNKLTFFFSTAKPNLICSCFFLPLSSLQIFQCWFVWLKIWRWILWLFEASGDQRTDWIYCRCGWQWHFSLCSGANGVLLNWRHFSSFSNFLRRCVVQQRLWLAHFVATRV